MAPGIDHPQRVCAQYGGPPRLQRREHVHHRADSTVHSREKAVPEVVYSALNPRGDEGRCASVGPADRGRRIGPPQP